MDSYSLKGKVEKVFDTQQKSDKFRMREFVVEVTSSNTRGVYIDYIKLQTVQANCDKLDDISKGDLVVVKWALMGRKYGKKPDVKYFTNVEALDITLVSKGDGSDIDEFIDENYPISEGDNNIASPPDYNSAPPPMDEEEPDDLPF